MFKIFVLVAILSFVVCDRGTPPTPSEQEAQLVAAGISSTAAAGLVAIGEKYKTQFENAKSDPTAMKTAIEAVRNESDTYIKTQPSSDQTAYAAYIAKKESDRKSNTPRGTTPAPK